MVKNKFRNHQKHYDEEKTKFREEQENLRTETIELEKKARDLKLADTNKNWENYFSCKENLEKLSTEMHNLQEKISKLDKKMFDLRKDPKSKNFFSSNDGNFIRSTNSDEKKRKEILELEKTINNLNQDLNKLKTKKCESIKDFNKIIGILEKKSKEKLSNVPCNEEDNCGASGSSSSAVTRY